MRANCVSIVYRIKDFQLFRYRLADKLLGIGKVRIH